ncbi:hypothetical protein J4219_05715 [Candidatus Woesearchaeota archaeon]|nr:hypothetical protein [Candidatus Woesearchaeota archaeon]
MKKGQLTVFIIIGLVLIFIIGTVLYMTGREESTELALGRARLQELPEKIAPVRDNVHSCIRQIATDGLKRLGGGGGYINTSVLSTNPVLPTEGEGVWFTQAGPVAPYWWYMKDKNSCTTNCRFDSKRLPLTKTQGARSMESQLEAFIAGELDSCVTSFAQFPGCSIQIVGEPKVEASLQEQVVITANYPLRITCEDQSVDVDEYFVNIDLNLKDVYELATNITNLQIEHGILEQATDTIIETYSGVDSDRLPPVRALDFGPPSPGTFWLKFEVKNRLSRLLASHIPLIQVLGVRNYEFVSAPAGVRDSELFELVYNRQFLIPLNKSYPRLEARFAYLPNWEPYFDLNCAGQLCQADSGTSFFLIPFSLNRYEFAYDVSYPVLVEIKDPDALSGQGYSFRFFLEENLRNSERFTSTTQLSSVPSMNITPSIFCDPAQRSSGEMQVFVKDGETLRGVDDASVSFICGDDNCNLGKSRNGTFLSRFPRCVGGTIRVTKPGYVSHSSLLDTFIERGRNMTLTLEPIRTVKVSVKDLAISKESKHAPWKFEEASGALRPPAVQETIIMMQRIIQPYEEQYSTVASVKGAQVVDMDIIPGKYSISIISLLKPDEDLIFPPDRRCIKIKKILGSDEKCQMVPEDPIIFNATKPFPYGQLEFEKTFNSDELRGAKEIEFRLFTLAIDKVKEEDRIVEDLSELSKLELYKESSEVLYWPVVKR